MAKIITFFLTIFFLKFIVIFTVRIFKSNFKRVKNLEINPDLDTKDYEQHIRRLNKFLRSKYKGVYYYASKKGSIYFYSKDNVRIYL